MNRIYEKILNDLVAKMGTYKPLKNFVLNFEGDTHDKVHNQLDNRKVDRPVDLPDGVWKIYEDLFSVGIIVDGVDIDVDIIGDFLVEAGELYCTKVYYED